MEKKTIVKDFIEGLQKLPGTSEVIGGIIFINTTEGVKTISGISDLLTFSGLLDFELLEKRLEVMAINAQERNRKAIREEAKKKENKKQPRTLKKR